MNGNDAHSVYPLMASLGFAVVSYDRPEQLLRLLKALNLAFGQPPISLHHDFRKSALDVASLPPNVKLVQPSYDTGWGTQGTVRAMIACLASLYEDGDGPDYVYLLSGTDYPLKTKEECLRDLTAEPADAYLHHREVYPNLSPDPWAKTAYWRYAEMRLAIPSVDKRVRFKYRMLKLPDALMRRTTPFNVQFKLYAGWGWGIFGRRAVLHLQGFLTAPKSQWLWDYYRHRIILDESILHTALLSNPNLKVSQNHHRYFRFPTGSSNPDFFTDRDYDELMASGAHFARKFDQSIDHVILDRIDRRLAVTGEGTR